MTRWPSTLISAVAGSTLSPSFATLPFTVTRRRKIRSSQARRDPTPAAASTFWRRSAVSACGIEYFFHVVGQERGQRRQLVNRVDAEFLEEQRGGAIQVCAGLALDTAFLDEAAGHKRTHDPIDVHPADGRDPRPRHRLLVGDHGE